MRTSLLVAAVIVVSSMAILGVWVVLGVLRDIVAEYRQRRTAKVALPPND